MQRFRPPQLMFRLALGQGAYRRERTGSETMKGDEDEDEEAEKNKEVDVLRVELEAFFSRIGTEMLSPKKKKTEKSRA